MRTTGFLEEVAPGGVGFLDEFDFPAAPPFLQLLLAKDGIFHGVKVLEPDELFDGIDFREAHDAPVLVGGDPRAEIGCDADIECAVALAGEDVDGGLLIHCLEHQPCRHPRPSRGPLGRVGVHRGRLNILRGSRLAPG